MSHPSDPTPPTSPARRSFFAWLTYLTGAAAAVLFAVPLVGYVAGALRRRPPQWVRLGPVADFPVGQTRLVTFDNAYRQPWDGMTAHTGVYVRYRGKDASGADDFLVFAVNCAHLGCPVEWFPQSGLFMCPCHGGVYYEDGSRASGPPPRGLFHCPWRVTAGRLEVQSPHYPTLHDTLTQKDG
jgi:Rieske Fe-S protein